MAQRPSPKLRALSLRGAEYARLGKHEEAVEAWTEAARLAPDHGGVAAALAAALIDAGRVDAAASVLAAARIKHGDDIVLLRLQAKTMLKLGHNGPAIGALYTALDKQPDSAQTHADLAVALLLEHSPQAALPHAEFAFRSNPTAETTSTLVNILLDLTRPADAALAVQQAIARGTDQRELLVARSLVRQVLGREADAMADARAAVVAVPHSAIARHNLATMLLQRGEFTAEAWSLYEGRSGLFNQPNWPEPERCWNGDDPAGKTILVHAEQGLGDTLQFVRYVPLLAAKGARVVLAVQAPLVDLLQDTPGAEAVIPAGRALPLFDQYIPLMSLPGRLKATLDTIPPPLPYAKAFVRQIRSSELTAGLVWAGNSKFSDDRKRSIDPALLAPLNAVPNTRYVSLQYGCSDLPLPGMHDAMAGVTDFCATAAAIAELDLVIAADTSVVHLAATMGKPVWLLSRFHGCWRWLQDRTDTPWYPTVRLYRQTQLNDWASVIGRVCDDLTQLASERRKVESLAA